MDDVKLYRQGRQDREGKEKLHREGLDNKFNPNT
jgi:hypothetical protein